MYVRIKCYIETLKKVSRRAKAQKKRFPENVKFLAAVNIRAPLLHI